MSFTRESLSDFVRPFVELSYPMKGVEHGVPTTLYGKGKLDLRYAVFWAVVFSVLRHVAMKYILSPLARRVIPTPPLDHKPTSPAMERHLQRVAAKKKEHNSVRFAEQAWAMAYCTVFWSIGMVSWQREERGMGEDSLKSANRPRSFCTVSRTRPRPSSSGGRTRTPRCRRSPSSTTWRSSGGGSTRFT